jgi:peptide methionine sulfoxide reductase MsrA
MILYFWMKIVKKQSNNTYINYFFQDINNEYTLSPYSNIGDNYKNTIMYLNENDAHELSNVMYISPNLLKLSKKKQRIIT